MGNQEFKRPIRKQMRRREVPSGVRFITFSCERRLPLLGTPQARDIFARSLREGLQRMGFKLLAWVAMPEHVHLLMVPPDDDSLARVLKSLKLSMQQRIMHLLRAGDPLMIEIIRGDGTPRFRQKGGGFDRNVRKRRHRLERMPISFMSFAAVLRQMRTPFDRRSRAMRGLP